MYVRKPTNRIPRPSAEAVRSLVIALAPAGYDPPEWLKDLVIAAYQSGRYDEASCETFTASLR